jgi:V8-like Glu-specific endopeptidase
MKKSPASLLALLIVTACGAPQSQSKQSAIIGTNDLVQESDPKALAAQGTLQVPNRTCNAFLIQSKQIAVAGHCADDPYAFVGFKFRNMNGKEARVIGIDFLDSNKDLVFFRLDTAYSDYYDFAGKEVDVNQPIHIRAFDFESKSLTGTDCSVVGLLPNKAGFKHSCDSLPKYSGAPLLQDGKVVGVHLGHVPAESVNLAVAVNTLFDDSSVFADLKSEVKLEWPHSRIKSPHVRMDGGHIRADLPHIRTDIVNGDCYFNLLGAAWSTTECAGSVAVAVESAGVLAAPAMANAGIACGKSAYDMSNVINTCGK